MRNLNSLKNVMCILFTEILKLVSLMSLLSVIILNPLGAPPSTTLTQWILTLLGVEYSGFALKTDPSMPKWSWDKGEGELTWLGG